MKRRPVENGNKKPKAVEIVSQTGVEVVDLEMKVTSEKLGPPIEEKLFTDDEKNEPRKSKRSSSTEAPNTEAAGEAAAADAEAAAQRKRERAAQAPERAEDLTMGEGFERIITHQFRVTDSFEEYVRLRAALRFRNDRASALNRGDLMDALDAAEDAAHEAAELAAQAKVAHDSFEIDAKVIQASMRQEALNALTDRKAELKASTGASGKAIAEEDIKAEMAAQHPDEYMSLESKRSKANRSVDLLDDLAKKLAERAKDLRAMFSNSRSVD